MIVTTSTKVITHVEGELSDVLAQSKHYSVVLQRRANAGLDMLHASATDRTRLQVLLDSEREMRKIIESTGCA